jgi:hypothetical protein
MKNLINNPIYICIGLTFILCILKICNIINWSWALCTFLIWMPLTIIFIIAFVLIVSFLLCIIYSILRK